MDLLSGLNLATKRNTTRVSDYATLEHYVRAWASGTGHHTLAILGRPGILKTSILKAVFPHSSARLYIEGATGPLALYRDLFLHLNLPAVFDDLAINEPLRPILQPLFDNYDVHTLRWASAQPLKVRLDRPGQEAITLGRKASRAPAVAPAKVNSATPAGDRVLTLPTSFQTTTRCCLITNSITKLMRMEALLDRAYLIEFDPSTAAVLERCRSLVDPEVWAWAKRHESILPNLSVRDLVQVAVDKKLGMPWEKVFLNRYFDPHSNLGAYLSVLGDPTLRSGQKRWARFAALTGKDRATFYRIQAEYRRLFPAPNLPRGRHIPSERHG